MCTPQSSHGAPKWGPNNCVKDGENWGFHVACTGPLTIQGYQGAVIIPSGV